MADGIIGYLTPAAIRLGKIQPLHDLLVEIGKLDANREYVRGWLFVPKGGQLTLESPATLLNINEVPPEMENTGEEDEIETPELAKIHQLMRFLQGEDIKDIIYNARQQKPDVDVDGIFSAVLYYHRFDAFMDILE